MQKLTHLTLTYALVVTILVASLLGSVAPAAHAQNDITTLTFAIPDFWAEMWANELIDQFEAQNPHIRVELVPNDTGFYFRDGRENVNDYFTTFANYASAADILYVNTFSMTATTTQAGFFLDLGPFTRTDFDLNVDEFYPPAWQSFQWDGGVWAMPLGVDATVLVYNPTAFDDAGLTYPSPNWSIYEFAHAVRELTRFDDAGQVERPAFDPESNLLVLFRSLLGRGLYDPASTPNMPQLSGADAEAILEEWMTLERDGYLAQPVGTLDYATIPMRIEQAVFSLGSFADEETPDTATVATLLPGGGAGLAVEGVAVSSGTQHPDAAYAFVKFLSKSPQTANSFLSARPARWTLGRDDVDDGEEDVADFFVASFSPEDEAFLDNAFANAIPAGEMRYIEYLPGIADNMVTNNLGAADAISEMQIKALADYQAALDRRNTPIIVAVPQTQAELAPGEIALRFGMAYVSRPLPNQAQWDQVIDTFVANNAVVGQIELGTEMFDPTLTTMAKDFDCFYLPYNGVPGGKLETLLNLDPFMDADVNFDRNDIYPDVLPRLQQDSRTWAFPLVIQPTVLRYKHKDFLEAGVPLPENGWTTSEFADALSALHYMHDKAPFVPVEFGGSTYFMLIASFGGLPFDYSTVPPTANFTNPDTISAIRQVLDLARNGYIQYRSLSLLNSSDAFTEQEDFIISEANLMEAFFEDAEPTADNPYRVVAYPTGTWYTPVAYDIGTAYISATAQNPAACYDWISQLAQRPDLLRGMPVRRAMINDPVITSSVSPDELSLYNQLDQLLTQPSTVVIPAGFASSDETTLILRFLAENWLNIAFDNYVLNNADLETELSQAEQFVNEFQACVANLPPRNPAMDEDTYFTQFLTCAISVDSSLSVLMQ